VRRLAFVLAVALASSLAVGAMLFAKYRLSFLSPAELVVKQPEQKRILKRAEPAENCSSLQFELNSTAKSNSKPIERMFSLTSDETVIYRAVLHRWAASNKTALNVSNTTYPFNVDRVSCECLQGVDLAAFLSASRSFHDLSLAILLQDMKLVDRRQQLMIVRDNDPDRTMDKRTSVENGVRNAFAHGLFSMSEIVFDKEHLHAIVSYGFRCGLLCGSGATVVLEEVDGEWKVTDRICDGWVS